MLGLEGCLGVAWGVLGGLLLGAVEHNAEGQKDIMTDTENSICTS